MTGEQLLCAGDSTALRVCKRSLGVKPCVPKKQRSRRKAIRNISTDVALSPLAQTLCEQLRDQPRSFSITAIYRRENNVEPFCKDISILDVEHPGLGNINQHKAIIDSLFCLAIYWHETACIGVNGSRPENIARRIFGEKYTKLAVEECKMRLSMGRKLNAFCSNFLKDIGTIFHLPCDAKNFILSIGFPTKKFRIIHEQLARWLIDAGITSEARKNGGSNILEQIKLAVTGTRSWNSCQLKECDSRDIASLVPPLMMSSQFDDSLEQERIEESTEMAVGSTWAFMESWPSEQLSIWGFDLFLCGDTVNVPVLSVLLES